MHARTSHRCRVKCMRGMCALQVPVLLCCGRDTAGVGCFQVRAWLGMHELLEARLTCGMHGLHACMLHSVVPTPYFPRAVNACSVSGVLTGLDTRSGQQAP